MIKTPLSTAIGGVGFYTKNTVVIGGHKTEPEQPFNPASLFENGEQGLFYDPHTLDVGLVGQTVPTVPDLSGNAINASNANSAHQSRHLVNEYGYGYLNFDGADDNYKTHNLDLTHTDSVTVIAAFEKLADTGIGIIAEFSENSVTNDGTFGIGAPFTAASNAVGFRSRGTNHANNLSSIMLAPAKIVAIGCGNISQNLNSLRINATEYVSLVEQGSVNFGSYPVYIGRRGGVSNPFYGNLYGLLIIDRILTDTEIQKVEQEFAKRMGITL